MNWRFRYTARIAACGIFLASCASLRAASVEATGVAAIGPGGVAQARQLAVRDAVYQAGLQAGAEITASGAVNPQGRLLESSRIRPAAEPDQVVVVREWRDGDLLHVVVQAENALSAQQAPAAQPYRKKIVALPFQVGHARQVEDLDDIWNGFPRELLHRLETSGKFLTRISRHALGPDTQGAASGSQADRVRQIAALNDSQFVLSGRIVDAESIVETNFWGAMRIRKRKFEVEVALHDGLTGALIARHRFDRLAEGEVMVGRDKPFASTAFFATDFGKAADAIFHAVTEAVSSDLGALPFTARIVRKKGRDIFLDAGATSRIAPGDSFVAYHRKNDLPVTELDNHADYGITETPVATVSIRQVQPLFSIGELADDAGDAALQAGDIVRFESIMKK